MLIFAQHLDAYEQGRVPTPTPTWVAGYNDWRKMGRWPEKGGGYRIRGPVKAREATATPSDPASWRRLRKNEKPRPGEVVRRRIVSVVPAWVWDVSRTHGAPLPERPRPKLLEGEAPTGLWDELAVQVETLGFEVLRMPDSDAMRGANGMTDYETRQVLVRTDMDPAAQVKTLATAEKSQDDHYQRPCLGQHPCRTFGALWRRRGRVVPASLHEGAAEKDGTDEGYSIPAQREANRRKAEQLGATIVAEFVDAGEPARKADRPDLMRMTQYVTEHQLLHRAQGRPAGPQPRR